MAQVPENVDWTPQTGYIADQRGDVFVIVASAPNGSEHMVQAVETPSEVVRTDYLRRWFSPTGKRVPGV